MSILQNFTGRAITYYPAELHESKEWYISYYVLNPYTNKMIRRKVKVNRIKSITERRKFAREIIVSVNNKLSTGWNPFIEQDTTRTFVKYKDAIKDYFTAKRKELKKISTDDYNFFVKRLNEWINRRNPDIYLGEITDIIAVDFMLYVKALPSIGNRSYNNHLAFYRTLWNWFVAWKYCKVNPFTSIPKINKKLIQKKRKYIERHELQRLVSFLEKENTLYLAACMLCYYCLLRPDDLSELRLSSFDFTRNLVFIRMEETKNKHDSYRVIPISLEKYLLAIDWGKLSPNDYIFSHRTKFTSGAKKLDSREFARYWADVIRPACGFGMEKQFYGLKDTGITNLMADGVSPGYVQGQADHSSLEVTNKYNHTKTPDGYRQLRELAKDI